MEHTQFTTNLLKWKDPNLKILDIIKHDSHLQINCLLDYTPKPCSHCKGKQIKYDFQKTSTIPWLDMAGFPTLLKLKKRRFQCKDCRKVTVAQSSIVEKNCQIPNIIRQKITQDLTDKSSLTDIARDRKVATSTVYRQLKLVKPSKDKATLPKVISFDEFSFLKGQLSFIAQDCETKNIITILENRRQTTIRNFFLQFPLAVRKQVEIVTMDMSGAYMPLVKKLFPNAKIVLDRFHIIQHLARAMMTTRIAIMKQHDSKSLPYRAMKYHWKALQKDSRKLDNEKLVYNRTFREHLTSKELVQKILGLSDELAYYYNLYQLLLFHFQEKNIKHFFDLIDEYYNNVNDSFKRVFKTFKRYRQPIENAMTYHYSNAKLEATNKLIKDIKRNACGFRNFDNFYKRILIALNTKKERTSKVLSRY